MVILIKMDFHLYQLVFQDQQMLIFKNNIVQQLEIILLLIDMNLHYFNKMVKVLFKKLRTVQFIKIM